MSMLTLGEQAQIRGVPIELAASVIILPLPFAYSNQDIPVTKAFWYKKVCGIKNILK
jgi:hypothetical protein